MIFHVEYQLEMITEEAFSAKQAQTYPWTNDDPVHWRQNIWKEGHCAILRQAELHKPMMLPAPARVCSGYAIL